MTLGTLTKTNTFTVTDIRLVLASFAADFHMIGQATGLRSRESVEETVNDLIGLAHGGYLEGVDLILWDSTGKKLRAAKFTVSNNAIGWANERPGNNLWPRTPGGQLRVIATLSSEWWALDEAGKQRARTRWNVAGLWSLTNIDTTHSDLTGQLDRQYSSNGYGLQRKVYS